MDLAVAYFQCGRREEALRVEAELINFIVDNPYAALIRRYAEDVLPEECERLAARSAKEYPESAFDVYLQVASCYKRAKDAPRLAQALAKYLEAIDARIAKEPYSGHHLLYKMHALLSLDGDLGLLESTLKRFRDLQPRNPEGLDYAGWLEFKKGRFDAALAEFQKADDQRRLYGEWPSQLQLYGAGFSHLAAGHAEAGRRLLRRVLAENPSFFMEDEARAAVKE
jgi:tetratricopeptide (TPR) repeat protein